MQKIETAKKRKILGIEFNHDNIALFFFIVVSLIISLFPFHYGFVRDEYYYIALSKHLAWGYVDVPPLMPFCMAIVRFFFGESITAMHLIPAFVGLLILIITREITRKLKGKLFAQILALTCILLAPTLIYTHSYISYDCLDHLFWVLVLYCLVLLLTSENKKYWLYIGVFVGLGLMSKFGMLWLTTGGVLALLCTKERKYFATWQFWVGALIALIIVFPYFIWITQNQFLTFEYFQNYSKNTAPLTVLSFIFQEVKDMNSFTFPVWGLGLYYFLFHPEGKKFRLFGLTFIFIFIICLLQQAKAYTINPIFPLLFAGGAVFIEKLLLKHREISIIGIPYIVLIAISGLIIMPVVRPIFPVDFTIKYLNAAHIFRSGSNMATEKYSLGLLPQTFADCFGWEELTAELAKIYYSLPEKERLTTLIYTNNYGEASAVYFFSKKYNLPMPISQHLQYYVWGYHNAPQNFTMITVGRSYESLISSFSEIKQVGYVYNKYAVPYEHGPIYLCRGLKFPLAEGWKKGRKMEM